jgi:hypothetical protein
MENVASLAVLLAFCVAIYALLASVVGRLKHKPFLMVSGERAVYSVRLLISVAFGDSTKIAKTILRVLICYLQRKWVLLGAILEKVEAMADTCIAELAPILSHAQRSGNSAGGAIRSHAA